jgi:hypothetical protein
MMLCRLALFAAALIAAGAVSGAPAPVAVHWVGDAPAMFTGVSWGVPWPQGTVRKDQAFALTGPDGKALPLQTWPLAYWPDGSLKFSGFATVAGAAGPYVISAAGATAAAPAQAVRVQSGSGWIAVDTGAASVRVGTRGADLIQAIAIDGREASRKSRSSSPARCARF